MKIKEMTKSQFVSNTEASKHISAYIVMKGKKYVGKILVHHGTSKAFVNVWIDGLKVGKYQSKNALLGEMIQRCGYGSASGYGYNKEHSALAHAFKSFGFDYAFTSQVESSGVNAIERLLKVTIIQAI